MISKKIKKSANKNNVTKKIRAKPVSSTVYIYRDYGQVRATSSMQDLPAGVLFVKVTLPYGVLNGPRARKCVGEVSLTPHPDAA